MRQNIIHIALVVRDYDEAIEFYTKKLHFKLVEDTYQPEQNKRWVVVSPTGSGGTSILLAKASNPGQEEYIGSQAGGRVFLFLSTDDFQRDYNEMISNGIEFVRPPKKAEYGTVAVFKDLYGNLWDLVELSKEPQNEDNISVYDDRTDRGSVIKLWTTAFGYKDLLNNPAVAIDKKLEAGDDLFFVLKKQEHLLGTIMAGYDGHRGWLYSLAVRPDARNSGLGTALLVHAEEALARMGCMKINIQVIGQNADILDFYTKNGYTVEDRISLGKQLDKNIPVREV